MTELGLPQQKDPGRGWETAGHAGIISAGIPLFGLEGLHVLKQTDLIPAIENFHMSAPETGLFLAVTVGLAFAGVKSYQNAREKRKSLDNSQAELLNSRMDARRNAILFAEGASAFGLSAISNIQQQDVFSASLDGGIEGLYGLVIGNNIMKINKINRSLPEDLQPRRKQNGQTR